MNAETFCEHFATFAEAPNGVAKLRALILQLAVQGKLGTQDVNNEPASDLIANLKQQSSQESPFALPQNWGWISLSAIATVVRGVSYQKHDATEIDQPGYVPLLRANNIGDGLKFDDLVFVPKKCVSPEQFVKTDDVVIAMSSGSKNLVGKAAQAETDFVGGFGAFCGVIRLNAPIDAKFFGMFFRSPYYRERIASEGKGIGINNVQKGSLLALPVPIPPLAEQRRIVAKVDQLLGLCDELAARQAARREARSALVGATLDCVVSARSAAEFPAHAHRLRDHFDRLFDTPTTLPQLRQAILQLAVQGQLVPQDPNDEPADLLLKRLAAIRPEKASSEEEHRRQRKYREPELLQNQGELPVLPPSWKWVSADEVTHRLTYGITVRPAYVEDGVPVISAREIRSGQVDLSIAKRIAFSDFDGLRSKCKLKLNDVLFSKTGTIGSVAKVTTDEPLCSAQNIAVLSPLIWPDYLELVLRSPAIQKLAAAGIKTTAIPDVQLGAISRFPIPLPPESEQKRIVSKVTELLSLCDALEAKLTQADSASTQLLSAAVHHLLNRGVPNG